LALGLEIRGKFSKGKIMKKLALLSMLLGLGLFTIGCGETKPKTNPPVPPANTDTSTPDETKPADGATEEEMPADEKPADESAAGEEKPGDEKPTDEKPADEKPADEKAPE
jgi:hypothetical protein